MGVKLTNAPFKAQNHQNQAIQGNISSFQPIGAVPDQLQHVNKYKQPEDVVNSDLIKKQ